LSPIGLSRLNKNRFHLKNKLNRLLQSEGGSYMDTITGFISEHPLALIIFLGFLLLLFLYFIFKNIIKVTMVILIVLFAVGGFFFVKNPDNIQKTIDMIGSGIEEIADKSKNMYKDLRELFKKGKEIPGSINKMLESAKEKADQL